MATLNKQTELELKVGLFVSLGLAVILGAILVFGSTEKITDRKNHYFTHFPAVDGLVPGAKVVIGGVPVGTIMDIGFDREKRDIRVDYTVVTQSAEWLRKDSTAEIATQGMLGDKYLILKAGSQELAEIPPGGEISSQPTKDITQFLTKGDQLMVNLNSITSSLDRILKSFEAEKRNETLFRGLATTAKNLSVASERVNQQLDQIKVKAAIGHLNSILEKVDQGEGTLGALINDPSLYDDAKALLGGANRNRVIRNLVRQTIKDNEKPAEK